MAELMGNEVLAQMLGDLISRCSLITLMYQSASAAEHSHEEHAHIVKAPGADEERAGAADAKHICACGRKSTFDRQPPVNDPRWPCLDHIPNPHHDLRRHRPYPAT